MLVKIQLYTTPVTQIKKNMNNKAININKIGSTTDVPGNTDISSFLSIDITNLL